MRPAMPVDLKELRRLHEAATPEKVFMTKFGVGNGNCLAASTSTLTGIPIETFPDFKEPGWFHNYQAFLRKWGWSANFVPAEGGKSVGAYDGLMLGLFSIKYAGREVSEDHCVVIQSELTRKEHTETGWSYETEFHLWHDPCPPEHSGFTEIGPLTGLILLTTNALPSLLDRIEAAEAENAELERDRERLLGQLKNLVGEIVYNAQQVPGRREWSLMLSGELMDELRMMLDGWHRRDAAREEEVNRS